ncbi:MAG: hypothetical protein KJI71_00840 [Patescibacteria group bacterium]|nr:hypothetical protein [Patescibacteria group bacterium]
MVIELTLDDITWLKKKYPKLKFHREKNVIRGELSFNRKYGSVGIKDSYFLEIKLQSKENSILPQVKEFGGKIKRISEKLAKPLIDLHVNPDGTLCPCIFEKEKAYFPTGFKMQVFFEQILEPYLYWISYTQKYKISPWEEYAHGNLGYLELYAEEYINLEKLREYFSEKELQKIKKAKGHHQCLCKREKELKNCHKLIYSAIYKLKNELYG